jgi:hypothetical protein
MPDPNEHYRREVVAEATAYVTSRFYPPLPAEYGLLAVQALEAYDQNPDAVIALPPTLNPLPRQAYEIDGGEIRVQAIALIQALRLEHMLYSDNPEGD